MGNSGEWPNSPVSCKFLPECPLVDQPPRPVPLHALTSWLLVVGPVHTLLSLNRQSRHVWLTFLRIPVRRHKREVLPAVQETTGPQASPAAPPLALRLTHCAWTAYFWSTSGQPVQTTPDISGLIFHPVHAVLELGVWTSNFRGFRDMKWDSTQI